MRRRRVRISNEIPDSNVRFESCGTHETQVLMNMMKERKLKSQVIIVASAAFRRAISSSTGPILTPVKILEA